MGYPRCPMERVAGDDHCSKGMGVMSDGDCKISGSCAALDAVADLSSGRHAGAGSGGANRAIHLVVPGRLDQPTGGYRFVLNVVRYLRLSGRDVCVHELPGVYPLPDELARSAARTIAVELGDAK